MSRCCEGNTVIQEQLGQYDTTTGGPAGPPVNVVTVRDCRGALLSQTFTNFDGTPYVLPPGVLLAPAAATLSYNALILYDDNGGFVRHYIYGQAGSVIGITDTDLAGASYTPVGPVTVAP